jgi:hypothetical protein
MQNAMEYPSTSIDSLTEVKYKKTQKNKKPQKNKKKFFEMRNVIKKVKTHGLKSFSKCLLSCMRSKNEIKSNWKLFNKKKTYKLFKSDICKSRNRSILYQPMREIMRVFSNIDIDLSTFHVKESMTHVYHFMLNITWDEFLHYLKTDNQEINNLVGSSDNTLKVTSSDVRRYYEYINQGVDYKKRSNIDDEYVNLYEGLNEIIKSEQDEKSQIDVFLNGFSHL